MPWHRCPSEVCEGKATTMRGRDRVTPKNEVVTASVIQGKRSSVRRGKELGVRAEERGAPLPSVLT